MHRKRYTHLLAAAMLVVSVGCAHRATVPAPPPAPTAPIATSTPDEDAPDPIASSIDYWQEIEGLPADSLETEYRQRQQDYLADRGDVAKRLKLIFVLALPETRVHYLESALSLINQYIDNAADDDPLLNWFLYLNDDLQQERYRERQLATLQKRQEQLQQKLEDLKSMEKALQERNAPTPGPR